MDHSDLDRNSDGVMNEGDRKVMTLQSENTALRASLTSALGNKAAVAAIAFIAGCTVMASLIFYLGLFPPVLRPVQASTEIPSAPDSRPDKVASPQITVPLSGPEVSKLYEDLVEYHHFVNSLKFWWPVLSVLAFSLAVAFGAQYVQVRIAEAKDTIREYVRREIHDDFKRETRAVRDEIRNAQTRYAKFSESLSTLQANAEARTQQSLGIMCWVSADGLRARDAPKEQVYFLVELAIYYTEQAVRALKKLNLGLLDESERLGIENYQRDLQSNLAYYHALSFNLAVLGDKREECSRKAVDIAGAILRTVEAMPDGHSKYSQLDSCLYAIAVCSSGHCSQEQIDLARRTFGSYKETLRAWFEEKKIKEISGREFSELESFYSGPSRT